MPGKIAFQGEPGAYSHQACVEARPDYEALPCETFEDVIGAVRDGVAELAMLPVENSTYGRVADIHRLLPDSGLHILDESFLRVRISLLGLPGTHLDQIREVRAHLVLLPQSAGFLRTHGIRGHAAADSAGAAATSLALASAVRWAAATPGKASLLIRDWAAEISRRIRQPATPEDSDSAVMPRNAMNNRAPKPSFDSMAHLPPPGPGHVRLGSTLHGNPGKRNTPTEAIFTTFQYQPIMIYSHPNMAGCGGPHL